MEFVAKRFDVVVIGAGPGGYVAAIRLAQLGKTVGLVERGSLGGVCLNWGCIPSKALISAANLYDALAGAARRGVVATPILDVGRMRAFKDEVVRKLSGGIAALQRANGVEVIQGEASFVSDSVVEVRAAAQSLRLEADAFVVATGARPIAIPGFEVDGVDVWSAADALNLPEIPGRLLVIGGGVVGMELGTAYAKLGASVTILEALPGVLTGIDGDAVRVVLRALGKRGVTTLVEARAMRLERAGGELSVTAEVRGKEATIRCDKVLLAAGFRPDADRVGLRRAGVALGEDGFVPVNDRMQTNVPTIYCIGDLAGPPLLAHKASRQGEHVAAVIAGTGEVRGWSVVPVAIFTDPEVAHVGLSEEQARTERRDVLTGAFPFTALGRAVAMGETEGFVKVIADRESRALLGVSLVGPAACELVAEAALAIELGARLEQVAGTVHAHPTLPEAFMEACKVALGEAVHVPPRRAGAAIAGGRTAVRP